MYTKFKYKYLLRYNNNGFDLSVVQNSYDGGNQHSQSNYVEGNIQLQYNSNPEQGNQNNNVAYASVDEGNVNYESGNEEFGGGNGFPDDGDTYPEKVEYLIVF